MSIHFGTSGWRAIIGQEFSFSNVRRVCQAIAKYLQDHHLQHKGVIIGYDTRLMSGDFANVCAQSLADQKIPVFLTNRDTPTPVIAYQIIKRKAAGGINITASHNPAEYNGIKFSPAYGGPAPVEVTKEIEGNIQHKVKRAKGAAARIKLFDPRPAYLNRLKQLVNFSAIRRAKLKIGVDLLYGTGRGYLDYLLEQAGCVVWPLHQTLDPMFGGWPPEPAQEQLKPLTKLIRKKGLHLGLALDADADRFGILDRDGAYIGANQIISLLTYHLINTRPRKKTVARTVATTHMIDALARRAGLQVVETPVGFKYVGQQIAKGNCLIGGEESGGLSIVGHVPEKDGILACLLIAELVAIHKKPLSKILQQLYRLVGPYYSRRDDFHLTPKKKQTVVQRIRDLGQQPHFLGKPVKKFDARDGYKFVFTDGSWIMFRASGTEPVIRCYVEAASQAALNRLLKQGEKLVDNRR